MPIRPIAAIPLGSFKEEFSKGKLNFSDWTIDTGPQPFAFSTGQVFSSGQLGFADGMLQMAVTQGASSSTGASIHSKARYGFGTYDLAVRPPSSAPNPFANGSLVSGTIAFFGLEYDAGGGNKMRLGFEHDSWWQNGENQWYVVSQNQIGFERVAVPAKTPFNGFSDLKIVWLRDRVEFWINGDLAHTNTGVIPNLSGAFTFRAQGSKDTVNGQATATIGKPRWAYVSRASYLPASNNMVRNSSFDALYPDGRPQFWYPFFIGNDQPVNWSVQSGLSGTLGDKATGIQATTYVPFIEYQEGPPEVLPSRFGIRTTPWEDPDHKTEATRVGLKAAWEENIIYTVVWWARVGQGGSGWNGMGLSWSSVPNYRAGTDQSPPVADDMIENPPLSSSWKRYVARFQWSNPVEPAGNLFIHARGNTNPGDMLIIDQVDVYIGTEIRAYQQDAGGAALVIPAKPPTTPMPLDILGTYFTAYNAAELNLNILEIPPEYNLLYIFQAEPDQRVGHEGEFFFPYTDVVDSVDIQSVRRAGRKVVLTVGGASAHWYFQNRTESQRFVDSFRTMFNDLGGVDGCDFNNFELFSAPAGDGGAYPAGPNGAANPFWATFSNEMVWIAGQLKQSYGPNFSISLPVSPGSGFAPGDRVVAKTMSDAGVLTYVAPQYYDSDTLITPAAMISLTTEFVNLLGGDQTKVGLAMGASYGIAELLGPTPVVARDTWLTLKGMYPNLRGRFGWNAFTDRENNYAFMKEMLKSLTPLGGRINERFNITASASLAQGTGQTSASSATINERFSMTARANSASNSVTQIIRAIFNSKETLQGTATTVGGTKLATGAINERATYTANAVLGANAVSQSTNHFSPSAIIANEWTNAQSMAVSDGIRAEAIIAPGAKPEFYAFNFAGISIPPQATIDGIEVHIKGYNVSGAATGSEFRLVYDPYAFSIFSATPKTITFTGTEQVIVLGGPTDKWGGKNVGGVWTAGDFNDLMTFWGSWTAGGAGLDVAVDGITMKVYYTSAAVAAPTGPSTPTTVATDWKLPTVASSAGWTNPNNIFAQDGVNSTSTVPAGGETETMRGYGFGLSVPAGATIDGIEVQVFGSANLDGDYDYWMLGDTNGLANSVSGGGMVQLPVGAPTWKTIGGPTNKWGGVAGRAWLPADFSDFMVSGNLGASSAGATTFNVDAMRVRVWYTAAASGSGTTPPPTGGGTTPTGEPSKVLAVYVPGYANLRITQVDPTGLRYNVLFLFYCDRDDAAGMGSYKYVWGYPGLNADIKTCQARGQKVILTIGGQNAGYNYQTNQEGDNLVSSIQRMYNQLGGFDGCDFNNFEAGIGSSASVMLYIAQRLKALYGSNFMITAPPHPNSTNHPVDTGIAMAWKNAGVLSFVSPQFYDGGNGAQAVIEQHYAGWANFLGDASKVVIGYATNYDVGTPNGSTLAIIQSSYNNMKAQFPAIRGAFVWNANTDAAQNWAAANVLSPITGATRTGGANPTPAPANPNPTPAPVGTIIPLPSKLLSTYFVEWAGQDLTRVTSYNQIYLFNAYPEGTNQRYLVGTTGAAGQSFVNSNGQFLIDGSGVFAAARVQAARAKGQRCVLTMGGARAGMYFDSRAKSQRCLDSINVLYTQMGGFDGVDWNCFEQFTQFWGAGTAVTQQGAEMAWISQQLKAKYGPNFSISAAPGPSNNYSPADRPMMQILNNAGVLDYAAPQFYDSSDYTSVALIVQFTQEWIQLFGGNAAKVVMGFGSIYGSGTVATTTQQSVNAYNQIKAQYPAIRGAFGFSSEQDEPTGYSFGSAMRQAIGF